MFDSIDSLENLISNIKIDSVKAKKGIKIAVARLKMNLSAVKKHVDAIEKFIHENYDKKK